MTNHEVARAVQAACVAIAARIADGVSRGADRLRDYDRGELAAARAIERRIRELNLEALYGPRTGMTEGG